MVNCCSTLFLCEWSARGKGDLWCMFAPGGTVRFGNRFTISAYLCALLWNVTQLLSLALHKLRNEKGGKNMETGVFSAHHSFFLLFTLFFQFYDHDVKCWQRSLAIYVAVWILLYNMTSGRGKYKRVKWQSTFVWKMIIRGREPFLGERLLRRPQDMYLSC